MLSGHFVCERIDVMAYLTDYISKQELETGGNNLLNINGADESTPSSLKSQDNTEWGNLHIARRLESEKNKLINALCQFPLTALWLLNEYEQNRDATIQEEDIAWVSEQKTALANIRKYYVSANQSLSCNHGSDEVCKENKQNLRTALQLFPFTFEDLVKLVDVFIYAYKFRGFCYQSSSARGSPDFHLMSKRFKRSHQYHRLKAAKLSDVFTMTTVNADNEQFLLLSTVEMHEHFARMLGAEHLWLNLREELVAANYRLVLFIANQYKVGFLDFDDLVQEGQTGLLKAVDRFDYRLGFQFSTYASYWIRQAISRVLSRCERVVRIPCGQIANINKVFRAKEQLISQLGREPSVTEIAEQSLFSEQEINMILSIAQTSLSLESSEGDGDNSFAPIEFLEQKSFTSPFKIIAQSDLATLLGKSIEMLTPREAKVICSHFGIDSNNEMTLQEIGLELNLTRERVRQIQVMALRKIKLSFGQQLVSFL
jgi:RNA polymerase primary sigma factor